MGATFAGPTASPKRRTWSRRAAGSFDRALAEGAMKLPDGWLSDEIDGEKPPRC
jgi:hypothetical protein